MTFLSNQVPTGQSRGMDAGVLCLSLPWLLGTRKVSTSVTLFLCSPQTREHTANGWGFGHR